MFSGICRLYVGANGFARTAGSRDSSDCQAPMRELSGQENPEERPTNVSSLIKFQRGRRLFCQQAHYQFAPNGISAQFNDVPPPEVLAAHIDVGNLNIASSAVRLGVVNRAGRLKDDAAAAPP